MQTVITSATTPMRPYARLPAAISRPRGRKTVFLLMAAYVTLLPFQFDGASIRFAPSDIFLALSTLLGLASIHVVRRAWTAGHLGLIAVFLTGTFIAVQERGAISSYVLLNKDVGMLLLLITFAILTTLARDWDTIRWFLRIFLWAVFVQNVIAIAALAATAVYGIDIPMWNYQSVRLSGLLVDPNAYGGLLLVAAAIHFPTYFSSRPLVPGISCIPWQPKLALRLVAIPIVVLAVLIAVQGSVNLGALTDLAKRPDQVQARLEQLNRALPLIEESPVLGIGVGVFLSRNDFIIHNTPLWLTTEFGMVGLLVLVALILGVLAKGVQAYRACPDSERPLVLGLMAAHVGMLGLSLGIEALYQRHWWMVMAFLGSAYAISRKPSAQFQEMA